MAGQSDYVLLLNNDTEVAPDFIEPLVERMESDPQIGITGPKIYYFADPKRIWSAGGVFGRDGWTKQLGVNELDTPRLNEARQVDYVTGCAMLVSRAVIEKAGKLDGRFFMYYEETDWCARAARAGYSVWYIPRSQLWHKIELTARDASAFYIYLMARNRLLFMHNLGLSQWRILRSLVTLDVRTILAWSVWPRYKKIRHLRQARWLGVWHYLRGRFGPPPAQLRAR
jgi:GT2 family glycosyltransferase